MQLDALEPSQVAALDADALPRLGSADLHLWLLSLDGTGCKTCSLSADERARALRFHVARDRHHFENARAMLRILLGLYARIAPGTLQFRYGPAGKPSLANATSLTFNLSHSGGYALICIGRQVPIGVDLEITREISDLTCIVEANFAPREIRALQQLPEAARQAAFLAYWTCKEAYVKACGTGITAGLDGFEIVLSPDTASLFSISGSRAAAQAYQLWSFRPLPDYHAAVMAEASGAMLQPIRLHNGRLRAN